MRDDDEAGLADAETAEYDLAAAASPRLDVAADVVYPFSGRLP